MSGNSNWVKKDILSELKTESQEKITSYYCRRLNTTHENYAHVFMCEMKDEKDLTENWNNIINLVAVYVQSEVENLLQRSNFYVWFFCRTKIAKSIQKSIEDDTFSSKKYVVVEESRQTEQERIDIIEKKLFAYTYIPQELDSSMIQKVVMKNFRTYKGEKVFDFSNGTETARLIVLFAPNGMGKTSFFDGIEWTFTETVDRFGKLGNKNVDGSILKNTEAKPKEEASVTIYMENGEWVKRKVSELNNRTKKDIGKGNVSFSKESSLKSVVGNNKAWSNLMLQHHKIDGFIAAANPQELYKEWCGLWDPSGEERKNFEKNYKDVKKKKEDLCAAVKKYEDSKAEYEEVNQKREFVDKLVKDIIEYNGLSYGKELVTPDFSIITAEEYTRWSNTIDCQIDSYQIRNENIVGEILYADTKLEEDINNYIRLSEQQKAFAAKLLTVRENIEHCQKKKEVLAVQSDLEKQKMSVEQELKRIYLICNDQIWYQQARSYFEALPKRAVLRKGVDEAHEKLSSLKNAQEKLKVDLQNKLITFEEQKEYHQLCAHLDEAKRLEKEKKELEEEISRVENQSSTINEKIADDIVKQENLRKKSLKSFEDVSERFHALSLLQVEENPHLETTRGVLVEALRKYLEIEEEIKVTDQKILEEENIEIRLGQILRDVRKIIEEQQLKNCPICHTSFDNHNLLIQSTYYTDSIEGEKLKQKRKEQEKYLGKKRNDIERLMEEYNAQLEMLINEISSIMIDQKNLLNNIRKTCEELKIQLNSKNNAIIQIGKKDQEQGIYVVYSKDGIENWRDTWNARQRAEIQFLEKQLEEAETKVVYQQEQITLMEESFKENEAVILMVESSSQDRIMLIQNEKDYIIKYTYEELRNLVVEKEKEKKILSDKLEKCKTDLEAYQNVSDDLQQTYVEQKDILQGDIQNNLEERDLVAGRINKAMTVLEESENLETIIRSDWKNRVKQKKEQLQREQENIVKATEILNRMKYNREIENYFSKNQEMAQKVKKSEKEKEEREKEVEHAVREYQKSRDRIEENLKGFFDNYQINDIYEKLEPHETLKKLTCEFGFNEDDKPELTFKVVGKDKKQYAPEWYFSTAQLNVVAFSVFLGKALQTSGAPIQSIFIDDPVGHFDEMNVVCFVDLLRNIVENTGRQLIISTHEESVFGLIQRKLPIGEYPVCYIDFRNAF